MRLSPRVYLAAPLFSEAEKRYNLYVHDLLVQAGYHVYLPQGQGEDARHRTQEEDQTIFTGHLRALDQAQMVIAICDGADTDSGTAWEVGYAYAKGIPVIALRTDNRMIGPERMINLMLEQSAYMVKSLEELVRRLTDLTPISR
jgi:nucleoside 2-deoxyribosyltransferase